MLKVLITGGNGNIAKIIKNNLNSLYDIHNPSRVELNLLDMNNINSYMNNKQFDILIHTAICGGRRTKEDSDDIVNKNVIMFENMMKYNKHFKMIINLDSGATYNRNSDIMERKEDDIYDTPTDYYGLSKYTIYLKTLDYDNIYNFRIFNIFHINEEDDRFIKNCYISNKNNIPLTIFEDKYFDFVYEDDFITILNYYLYNINNLDKLDKTINISYEKKYKLSEIASLINNNNVILKESSNNYCGDNSRLRKLNLPLLELETSIKKYIKLLDSKKIALIFGATGSIGNYIYHALQRDDIEVIGSNIRNDNIESLNIKNVDIVVWAQGDNINDNINNYDYNRSIQVMDANCYFILNTLKFLLKHNKINNNAKLVIISSIWELNTRDNKLSYSISKSALNGLVKSVSYDLSERNILINNILPGVIDNEMTRRTLNEEQINYIKNHMKFNRLVNLEDLYKVVKFFVIDNTAITSQSIKVDLGFTNIIKYVK